VVADALDADAVKRAVGEAEPDVIVHEPTAIPPAVNMRRFDREFALTNRLRTDGTDGVLSAGKAVGVKQFVAQSNAAVTYARTGGPVKQENAPLDHDPSPAMRQMLAAICHLEAAVNASVPKAGEHVRLQPEERVHDQVGRVVEEAVRRGQSCRRAAP
jgi:nucleoside-diphosphate-sugar epimerase